MNEFPVVRFLKDWLNELEDDGNEYVMDKHYLDELKRLIGWFDGVEQRRREAEISLSLFTTTSFRSI